MEQPLTLLTWIREMPDFKSRRGHRPPQLFPQSVYRVTDSLGYLRSQFHPLQKNKSLLYSHDKLRHTKYTGEIHLVLRSLLFWHVTKRQAVQFIMNCLPIQDGTDGLSRNIGS